MGKDQQGRAGPRPGDSRKRLARPGVEGAVRGRAAGDEGARSEGAEARQGGKPYLLSGLLRCGVCGRPYRAQGAKSGQFAYYICGTLFTEGAGTCTARYLNAPRLETFVVEKIRERILNEETIVALVQLVAEEIDAMAGELAGQLEVVEAEPVRREEAAWEALRGHRDERVDP